MKTNGNTIRGDPAIYKESALSQLLLLVEPKADEIQIITDYVKLNTLQDLLEHFPELRLSTQTEQKIAALYVIVSSTEGCYDL